MMTRRRTQESDLRAFEKYQAKQLRKQARTGSDIVGQSPDPSGGGHSLLCDRDGSYCSKESQHEGPCNPHGVA